MDADDRAATVAAGSGLGPDAADRIADQRPTVVVVGDAVLDVWKWGRCRRLCREAPVPVVDVERDAAAPGAAGNTAANLAALGARTRLVALTGDDRAGTRLRDALRRSGVDASRLHRAAGATHPSRTGSSPTTRSCCATTHRSLGGSAQPRPTVRRLPIDRRRSG